MTLDPLPEELGSPEETGDTYAENALIKARAAAQATGRAAFADDSGIEAEALGWAPGVRTARFAGEHATDGENLAKLHREAPPGSRARYVCVIAHVDARRRRDPVRGHAARARSPNDPSGEGGFGYDPLFVADEAPGPHDGRAHGRREGRDLPPRPRRPGAVGMAQHALTGRRSHTAAPAAAPPRSRSRRTRS